MKVLTKLICLPLFLLQTSLMAAQSDNVLFFVQSENDASSSGPILASVSVDGKHTFKQEVVHPGGEKDDLFMLDSEPRMVTINAGDDSVPYCGSQDYPYYYNNERLFGFVVQRSNLNSERCVYLTVRVNASGAKVTGSA